MSKRYLVKTLIFQAYWFVAVMGGRGSSFDLLILLGALIISVINFRFSHYYSGPKSFSNYLVILLAFFTSALMIDGVLILSGLMQVKQGGFPQWWLVSLWIIFMGYYDDIFQGFRRLPGVMKFALGALAGPLTYYSGSKLSTVLTINQDQLIPFFVVCALLWGCFFLASLKLYPKLS